jgi:hypothetical protein
MITVSLFFTVLLIGIISFFIIEKKTHPLTFIFLFMVIEFFFTSYISVIVDNASLWTISKSTRFLIMFRVAEVVLFPLMLIWFIEALQRLSAFSKKIILGAVWVFLLVGIESILIHIKIFTYKKWEPWGSIIFWSFFLLFISFLQTVFNRALYKEGV